MAERLLSLIPLLCAALVVLIPLAVIVSSSFKHETEIFRFPMTLIPEAPTLANFVQLADHFPLYLLNSFKVTLVIVFIQLLTATTGAYAFSKLRWKGRDALFLLYIASIMVPVHTVIIPQFILIRTLGLYDSHLALILVSSFTAFGTFLIKQFFLTVPESLLEAARMDGAGEYRIFLTIMIPLSKPALATLVIFSFRYFWNDFFTPLVYLTSRELKTLPLGISDFVSEATVVYGPQMAASLISIVPMMVVFFSAQRYFVEGIVATGIKG